MAFTIIPTAFCLLLFLKYRFWWKVIFLSSLFCTLVRFVNVEYCLNVFKFFAFFSPCWKQFGHMFSCCCCGILPVEIKIYLFDLTFEKHWDQYLIGALVQPRRLEKPLLTNYWVASIYNRNSNNKKEGRPRQLTSWNLSASSLGAWFVALWYYVTSVYNLNWMRGARLSIHNVKLLRRRLAAQVAAHFSEVATKTCFVNSELPTPEDYGVNKVPGEPDHEEKSLLKNFPFLCQKLAKQCSSVKLKTLNSDEFRLLYRKQCRLVVYKDAQITRLSAFIVS